MQEAEAEGFDWRAELAADNHVTVRHGAHIFELSATEAMRAGLALMAASVIANSKQQPPVGTPIENCHFPVTAWSTGRSVANGEPVLLLTIPGGQVVVYQLTGLSAEAAGQALVAEAKAGRRPSGQRPN
jgi:S-formylglutathione hydrolase FrmB